MISLKETNRFDNCIIYDFFVDASCISKKIEISGEREPEHNTKWINLL